MIEANSLLICPSCDEVYPGTDITEATTLADHGVCWTCHHEMLAGQRCRICYELGHDSYRCPDNEVEPPAIVYATGICHCSACVPKNWDRARVEIVVNIEHPTGISSKWAISDENFLSGESNPCPCEEDSSRQHWLLNC